MLDAKTKELVEETALLSAEKRRADALEKEKSEGDAKIASLERQLAAFREAQASSAKRVRRETSAKFEARASKVASIVESLRGRVIKKMLQLGQVKNNLQFVEELQSATPSLDEEKAELIEEGARLADAFSVYDQTLKGITRELVVSLLSADPGNALVCDSLMEMAAANVRASDFAGSNDQSAVASQLPSERQMLRDEPSKAT